MSKNGKEPRQLVQIKPVANGAASAPKQQDVAARKLDLAEVREKLSKSRGPQYWRSLEELSNHDDFNELLEREFPVRRANGLIRCRVEDS
jgi:MoCo/4Fe-4S cofactor protein with predicted Tat translocation signal